MNVFRNIAFAIVSIIALDLIFWAYSSLLRLIVGAFISLPLIWTIILYVVFGALVFGVVSLVASFLSMIYLFICKIAASGHFVLIWTIICVVISVILNCIYFWPFLASIGIMGVIGALMITVNLIVISLFLCVAAARAHEEEYY